MTDADLAVFPRLLFALGLYGKPVERDGEITLQVTPGDLLGFYAKARIKDVEPRLRVLEISGLLISSTEALQFMFPGYPDLIVGLAVFAKACRPLTNKETNPPVEFLRVDLRLLQMTRKKVRHVPLDPEEAIRALSDEKEIAFIRDLNAWARTAGYHILTRCTGVHMSEINVVYHTPKPPRSLFGFRTEDGRLHLHLNFNQTKRILPYVVQTPPSFRELYYQRCTCLDRGQCKEGLLLVDLDGAARRLCGYSYLNLPEEPSEHHEIIKWLVEIHNAVLIEREVRIRKASRPARSFRGVDGI